MLFLFILFGLPKTSLATISFTIDNPVREGDYFILDATLSGISSASAFVQGVFTHTSSPSYFGFTWGQKEDWVSYQSSTTKDFITQNFPILLKDTLQKIWVRPDFESSAFKGSGDYFLKLRRYTGSGDSSAGDSNVLTIYLLAPTPIPTETPTSTPTPTAEPTLTLNPTKTPTPTPIKTLAPTVAKTPTPGNSPTIKITSTKPSLASASGTIAGEILGESTSAALFVPLENGREASAGAEIQTEHQIIFKYTFVFGSILTAISGGWLYFRHRSD